MHAFRKLEQKKFNSLKEGGPAVGVLKYPTGCRIVKMCQVEEGVEWFLAEVTFTDERPKKIQIEHIVLKLFEIHYGMAYLYENPKLLEENRVFAVMNSYGDTWLYRKDTSENCGIRQDYYGEMDFEKDYVNVEALFPFLGIEVPYGEYGEVYYDYNTKKEKIPQTQEND